MDFKTVENFINSGFGDKEKTKKLERAKELVSRGLTDEKIIIEIVKKETEIPKRLPAELYDKMNYMCRRWMDRIARFEIDYDFIPDVDALKAVIICLLESAPVFHSAFIDNHISPYWRVADYHIDDVFSVIETADFQLSADEFLLRDISVKSNVQIKIGLLICEDKSKLCFAFNHMCMDGGGLKLFLDRMFRGYDNYVQNRTVNLYYSEKSRSYECVYDDMSDSDVKIAKKLYTGKSAKDKHTLPFTKAEKSDGKILIRKKIGKDIFEPARLKAKEYGATVNDLVSAAYIRAFYDVSGCDESESVGISCAVDLRRYMRHPENIGYTNHTTFMPCTVSSKGETMADTLKDVVRSTNEAKNDRYLGLHGLPLLNLSFSSMFYIQAELITAAFYNNANLAVSNVGKIEPSMFAMNGNEPTGVAVAGGAKEKPCATMNALSYNGDLMLSSCIRGNEADRKMMNNFFDRIEENIKLLCI